MLSKVFKPVTNCKFFLFCIALLLSTSTISQAASIAYTYDAAGRLLTTRYNDGQRADFAYDETGNITGQTTVGGTVTAPMLPLLLEAEPR